MAGGHLRTGWLIIGLAACVALGGCATPTETASPTPPQASVQSPNTTPASSASQTLIAPPAPSASQEPIATPAPSPTGVPITTPAPGATPAPSGTPWGPTASVGVVTRYHVPVLMYHRVKPASQIGRTLRGLVVFPDVFEAQMKALKAHGWHTMTSAQLASAMEAGRAIPRRTFVITFDDGARDGYLYAYPILKKYGFTATFFVIIRRVGRPGALTWTMMRTMVADGMEIGNHTVDHVLRAFRTPAKARAQVLAAQAAIFAHVGVLPVSFAYPLGRHPRNLYEAVMRAGIEVAYTTVPWTPETLRTRFLLPRIRMFPSTTPSGLLGILEHYR